MFSFWLNGCPGYLYFGAGVLKELALLLVHALWVGNGTLLTLELDTSLVCVVFPW